MFDKVLVTTDGSPFADEAVELAIQLAEKCGAELRAVTVTENPPFHGMPESTALYDAELYRSLSAELEKLGREALERVTARAEAAGRPCTTALRHGAAAEQVVAEATEWGADVVVIATHGRSGLRRLLLGSVANQIVNHAPCPVLLHRARPHDH